MLDLFENVGLLVALVMSGAGVTFIILIMFLKALDYMDNGND